MKKIKKFLKSEKDHADLLNVSSKGKISIWMLPDHTYVVPSMTDPSHESPVPFLHISKNKCTFSKCKEKSAKIHALTKKDQPLCLHTFLIHALGQVAAIPSLSTDAKKPSIPKINRDRTVDFVMSKIGESFPTMTKMESSSFIQKSRRYIEKLLLNKKDINQTIRNQCLSMCTVCTDVVLEDWPWKPRRAFLLSVGHLVQIEIPLKFCRSCLRVFYPGKMPKIVNVKHLALKLVDCVPKHAHYTLHLNLVSGEHVHVQTCLVLLTIIMTKELI